MLVLRFPVYIHEYTVIAIPITVILSIAIATAITIIDTVPGGGACQNAEVADLEPCFSDHAMNLSVVFHSIPPLGLGKPRVPGENYGVVRALNRTYWVLVSATWALL